MDSDIFFARYRKLGEKPEYTEIPRFLRINTLKIKAEDVVKRLGKEGIQLSKVSWLRDGYAVSKARFSPGAAIEGLLGYYYIQEAAAQLPAEILAPNAGDKVADLCASPGGKTTQLAQLMEDKGLIVALDKSHRLDALRNNLEKMGVGNTVVYKKDARFVTDFGRDFDKILLDAPCSGNFVTDRRWFSKRRLKDFNDRAAEQKELLKAAWKVLKPGGVLVYSTCSLEPEENEEVISFALGKFGDMKVEEFSVGCDADNGLTEVFGRKLNPEVVKCKRFWPWKTGTEGFFIAKLRKDKDSKSDFRIREDQALDAGKTDAEVEK